MTTTDKLATIPADVAQLLITKLDLRAVTVKEAKAHAMRYGVSVSARTREQVAREIGRASARA